MFGKFPSLSSIKFFSKQYHSRVPLVLPEKAVSWHYQRSKFMSLLVLVIFPSKTHSLFPASNMFFDMTCSRESRTTIADLFASITAWSERRTNEWRAIVHPIHTDRPAKQIHKIDDNIKFIWEQQSQARGLKIHAAKRENNCVYKAHLLKGN